MSAARWTSTLAIASRVVDGYDTKAITVSEEGCARAIALVFAGFGDGPQTARLIEAAPALAERLRDIVSAYDAGSASALQVWIEDTRALLEKACPSMHAKPYDGGQILVFTSAYEFAHGKKPAGRGQWAFYFGESKDPRFYNGLYSVCKARARADARASGFSCIKVGS